MVNEILKSHGVNNPELAASLAALFNSLASDKAFTDKLYKEFERKAKNKARMDRYNHGGGF